ncbi:unnamed protein product [Urochloa decumbens]|uniref:Homeobox-leucine zipper protein n=1 Tax=Urochloa decumbens TaxID=240449 RepID=A0ABC9G676_9POAL
MKRPRGGSPSLLPTANPDDDGYGAAGMEVDGDAAEDQEMMACGGGGGEKKRRLSAEQVRALERSFDVENKLEPERKARLARDLGLQPRQVAVWFQNRRARWKTKQLERDYAALRHSYDSLRHDHDALRRDKDALAAEIKELKAKLGDEEAAASFTSVKAEPAVSDGPPAAGVGSSESDSSAVVNDLDAPVAEAPPVPAEVQGGALLPAPAAAACAGAGAAAAASHGAAFFHGGFLKVEEDETGFLDDDEPCGGFFAVEQPPPMAWWTEPTEHWN